MFVPKINKNKISHLIDLRRSPEYIAGVKKIINTEFQLIKKELIANFNRHPVTVEIEAGPQASNTSGTLGGYGNLFSYIGFNESDKPTNAIRNQLSKIFINNIKINKDGSSIVVVSYPKPREIFAVTPLPWAEGRSWAEGIEQGLPGFGSYLNTESDKSRSGEGIQVKNGKKKGKFRKTRYISRLIVDFERKIMKLNRSVF